MGQKIRDDKITALSQGGGFVQLASGAFLTIGGQQYVTTTQLSVALPALTANNLYYVYAVISGGAAALVISQNANSVGPSGSTSWKLVGAFYANGVASPAFGSFVNIEGSPETETMAYLATLSGFGTATNIDFTWRRVGDLIEVSGRYTSGTVAGTEARWTLPTNLTSAGSPKITAIRNCGSFVKDSAEAASFAILIEPSVAYFTAGIQSATRAGTSKVNGDQLMNSTALAFMFGKAPISGWSNTPLKDL